MEPSPQVLAAASAAVSNTENQSATNESPQDHGLVPITSPMVGTFYSAQDPESPPFASIGSEVTADTVVCIIEAEVSGTIEKILVKNEQAIEYGQSLMMVRPKS